MRFSGPQVRAKEPKGRVRDRETSRAAADAVSVAGRTGVRVGVVEVAILAVSSVAKLVILAEIVLLPSLRGLI